MHVATTVVWVGLVVAMERLVSAAAATAEPRCLMYLTGQHAIVPTDRKQVNHITHVALAFLNSGLFNGDEVAPGTRQWPLFSPVADIRSQFAEGTKVLVAIGGWGDTAGFEVAARDKTSRSRWAKNVAVMVDDVGADGIDVDWEYPGGNGDDYKIVPNSEKKWQVEAYPLLLAALRAELAKDKLITAAVPGLERDMIAFTSKTMPNVVEQLDFINVMTYDLFNRRDTVTKHHTSLEASRQSLQAYMDLGAPAEMLNLGFAFYVKWFMTEECPDKANPLGCATQLLEDPDTGGDLGRAGAFSYHDPVPEYLAASYERAVSDGVYDQEGGGGYYYWDEAETRWWSFDPPDALLRKFDPLLRDMGIGGVFAWGLGEDAPDFAHLDAVNRGLEGIKNGEGIALGDDPKGKESKASKRLRNHLEL